MDTDTIKLPSRLVMDEDPLVAVLSGLLEISPEWVKLAMDDNYLIENYMCPNVGEWSPGTVFRLMQTPFFSNCISEMYFVNAMETPIRMALQAGYYGVGRIKNIEWFLLSGVSYELGPIENRPGHAFEMEGLAYNPKTLIQTNKDPTEAIIYDGSIYDIDICFWAKPELDQACVYKAIGMYLLKKNGDK